MKKLKTLEEHDSSFFESPHDSKLNGIACPNCGDELIDSFPNIILSSYPPKKNIECGNCGFKGYRNA